MYDLKSMFKILGNVVYGNENKLAESELMVTNVIGVRDSVNNELHLVVVSDSSSNTVDYSVNAIYEAFLKEPIWEESINKFQHTFDIDFYTLISYVCYLQTDRSSTNNAISVSLQIAKVLSTI